MHLKPFPCKTRGLDNPLNKNTGLKVKVIEIGENCIIRIEEVDTNNLFLETRTFNMILLLNCLQLDVTEVRKEDGKHLQPMIHGLVDQDDVVW